MPTYTNRQLPHEWVHRSDFDAEGKGSNFYFQGPWIFSYGRHFPMAVNIAPNAVVYCDASYSNSTARHQSYLRQAINTPSIRKVYVPDLIWPHNVHNMVDDLLSYLREQFKDLKDLKGNKPRQFVSIYDNIIHYGQQAFSLLEMMDHGVVYGQFIDHRNPTTPTPDARQKVIDLLAEIRSGDLAERYQRCTEQLERQSVRMQGKAPGEAELTEERINEWLAGEVRSIDGHRRQYGHDLMRIAHDGMIETSQGVTVPRVDVERAWPRIRYCYQAIEAAGSRDEIDFSRHAHRVGFGSFKADKLTTDGTLIVGCHRFTRETIFRLAKELGLS